jgi:membrane protease YdiL (CAAX protease family)
MLKLNPNNTTHLLLAFAVVTIVGAITFGLLGKVFALMFIGIDAFSPDFNFDSLSKVEEINFFRLTQPFNTVGMFLSGPIFIKYYFRNEIIINFSSHKISFSTFLSSVILIFLVKPLVVWFALVNKEIDFSFLGEVGNSLIETSNVLSEKILLVTKSHSIDELMLNVFIIALLPAVAEEFFFRGVIQQFLFRSTKNYHLSIWITSVAFGLLHLNIVGILPLIFLGAILGYIYHYSQNIWISVVAHFINNASLLFVLYKYPNEMMGSNTEGISTQSIMFSAVMSFSLLFFMYTVWEHRNTVKVGR